MIPNIFKRRKESPHAARPEPSRWQVQQRIWMDYLVQRTMRLSLQGRKAVALLLLALFLGGSIWLLVAGFRQACSPGISVTPIKTIPLAKPVEEVPFSSEALGEKGLPLTRLFDAYKDSLAGSQQGQADSLNQLETLP
ncbi:hypothetical protein V9K67_20740 [Paraflavisolibacter sp. H34]|uniref:hypothetical protein n=1 Tax=Huijunlia imazamoxiresistens TaxID=3127457 RepID=UPI0030161F03